MARKMLSILFALILLVPSTMAFAQDNSTVLEMENTTDSKNPSSRTFGIPPAIVHTVHSKTSGGTIYGGWTDGVSGSGPATLTLAKTVGWSNQLSGTLKVSRGALDASLGFSSVQSASTTASYAVTIPKGKKYKIQYRKVYKRTIVKQSSWWMQANYTEYTNYTVDRYSNLEYRWVQI